MNTISSHQRLSTDFKIGLLFIFLSVSSGQRHDIDNDSDDFVEVVSRGSGSSHHTYEDVGLREILCPGSNTKSGGLLRYDLRAGRCSEIGTQGHCGRNMIFKEDIDSSAYGYCECDFEHYSVPLVYHLPSHSCYPIYQQAYCKNGEWLVISQQAKGPICERKRCTSDKPIKRRSSKILFPGIWDNDSDSGVRNELVKNSGATFVPLNGTGPCVQLGEQSNFCDSNEKVLIVADDIYPRCTNPDKSLRRLSIIPNACPPGSYYSIIGYCQPVWEF